MKSDVAISTISWIRTPEESKVVLQTIEYLNKLNLPIVIVDAGSPKEDLEIIKRFNNVSLSESKEGLTSQLIKSHRESAKVGEHLFYLHTDKLAFAKDSAPEMIKRYRKLVNKGIFVPTRTTESLNTYPEFQMKEEEYLNFFMSDYVGIKADYYAGPKIYPTSLVKYLDMVEGNIGWGIEAYLYAIAKRLNLSFDFFSCYMQSPNDVDDVEKTKRYRLKIMQWQIEGLIQGQEVKL